MNRQVLLRTLAEKGYKGKPALEDVRSYLESQGFDTKSVSVGESKTETLDTIWSKTVHLMCDAGEQVQQHEPPGAGGSGEQPTQNPQKSVKTADEDDDDGEVQKKAQRPGIGYTPGSGWKNGPGKVDAKAIHKPEYLARVSAHKAYDRRAKSGRAEHASAEEAEGFLAWARLAIADVCDTRFKSYRERDRDESIVAERKTLTTGGLGTGEALAPEQYVPTLIENVEKYGAARIVCPVFPMSQHTAVVPRLTGDFAAAGVNEGASITAQNTPTTNQVTLVAKKIGGLVQVSAELMNDAALSMVDLLTRSMGRGLAKKEDQDFFLGDGTSTYDGFLGCGPALSALSGTIANIAGLVVAAGNTFDEFTLTNSRSVVARIPEYADNPGSTFWVTNRRVAHDTLFRLEDNAGGNTRADIQAGSRPMHLGYPVVYSQVMPKADANSQIAALFGDFSMGAKLGIVNGSMSLSSSDQRYFESDIIAFRILERLAIAVHDVGNASATAASREAGPIVGLISAAS